MITSNFTSTLYTVCDTVSELGILTFIFALVVLIIAVIYFVIINIGTYINSKKSEQIPTIETSYFWWDMDEKTL